MGCPLPIGVPLSPGGLTASEPPPPLQGPRGPPHPALDTLTTDVNTKCQKKGTKARLGGAGRGAGWCPPPQDPPGPPPTVTFCTCEIYGVFYTATA